MICRIWGYLHVVRRESRNGKANRPTGFRVQGLGNEKEHVNYFITGDYTMALNPKPLNPKP